MSESKPAIVIVPGGWHVPSHYASLEKELSTAGYEVTTCSMPSCGPPEPLLDFWQDVAVVQKSIQSYIDSGLNVVLVMHSLGGATGGSACKGFRPQDQANGKGITALAYITAFPLAEGFSIIGASPDGKYNPWIRPHGEPGTGIFFSPDNPPYDPKEIFYNDCTEEQKEAAFQKLVLNHSESVCWTPVSYTAWKEIESNYLICEIDNAVAVEAQEFMSSQEGGLWKRVERLRAGHSPFLSKPKETANYVRRCAGEKV